MGFCRRCGDIVLGARCKCGGTAVAPVVPWNQENHPDSADDRWSKTYVQRTRSLSPTRSPIPQSTDSTVTAPSPAKRFPRPISHVCSPVKLGNRVSAHIASSTSHMSQRPPSPLKNVHAPAPEVDILLSFDDATLSKVYGSVLQPKESLTAHSCAVCLMPFPPDATIYPDPASIGSSSRFLCRACYETNGGTKGKCPTCSRPVLTLKSEGQFIYAANQFWHKKCFNCSGCLKYIGDTPMVDLLGRPSCADCFESCLKRDPSTPKKYISASTNNSPRLKNSSNIGGMSSASKASGRRTREGSPAMEELEQRLGISGRGVGSPVVEDLSRKLAVLTKSSPTSLDYSPTARKTISTCEDSHVSQSMGSPGSRMKNIASPTSNLCIGGAEPDLSTSFTSAKNILLQDNSTGRNPIRTAEALEGVKQKFVRSSSPGPRATPHPQSTTPSRVSHLYNFKHSNTGDLKFDPRLVYPASLMSLRTPDLMSDSSDNTTQPFLAPDSLPKIDGEDVFSIQELTGYSPNFARRDFSDTSEDVIAEKTAGQMTIPTCTPHSGATPSEHSRSAPSFVSPLTSSPAKASQHFPNQSLSGLSTSSCAGCGSGLFSIRGGGKFVTVPGDGELSMTYHVECFKCAVCNDSFNEVAGGQAVFVKANGGACHVECAPSAKMMINKISAVMHPNLTSIPKLTPSPPAKTKTNATQLTSSRLERPSLTAPPTLGTASFPRFGSSTTCPGCSKPVFPMEQGVVPGPQNTRWHASCLICGGKRGTHNGMMIRKGREERKTEPGCGKRLDSAAKTGADGSVWCRECLLLLGMGGSSQASHTRSPFLQTSKLIPQNTGTTTIVRQFTGLGGGNDPSLLRQLTGGGLSPTRSISPTKQPSIGRPRPKSVIGMRTAKSIDEGRGMFLVRQLTGAG